MVALGKWFRYLLSGFQTNRKRRQGPASDIPAMLWSRPAVQRIFKTWPGENKKLDKVKRALENYFATKRIVVAERYKFRSREEMPEEPIDKRENKRSHASLAPYKKN